MVTEKAVNVPLQKSRNKNLPEQYKSALAFLNH